MNETAKELTCDERIDRELESTLSDLRALFARMDNGEEDAWEELNNYPLCVDYVEPEGEDPGYIRYQISWGGPSDEFRFFFSPAAHGFGCYRIEYVFQDWFDGATRAVTGEDFDLLSERLFQDWDDCEMIQAWIDQAAD